MSFNSCLHCLIGMNKIIDSRDTRNSRRSLENVRYGLESVDGASLIEVLLHVLVLGFVNCLVAISPGST